ncbi:hypothetical protein NVP1052A_31 [Vibrio phage 1.052.A._10N.286.46.C3]|nr:hypothetical protein NVP1052A_31 [Vibrio phage 1.052.A._10N.286.46.C3]
MDEKKKFHPKRGDSEATHLAAIEYSLDLMEKGVAVEITVGKREKKRSLSANAQQHVWYKAISESTGDDIKDVERRCKKDFGLPILLADPDMGKKIDWMLNKIGYYQMTPQRQMSVMGFFAVTSLFSSSQHKAYRDAMEITWNARGVHIGYLGD